MRPTTIAAVDQVGISPGDLCLDVGCGGGDVTVELARRVAPHGRAIGLDIDEVKLHLARAEAQGVPNVEFRKADSDAPFGDAEFDLVYARFLLSHLSDPAATLHRMHAALKPGGQVLVEDIDFSAQFSHPENQSLSRYREIYTRVVRRRGGDPHIGPRLPALLLDAGFTNVCLNVFQLAALEGEVKLLSPMTMESIADAAVADRLATREECGRLVAELYDLACNPRIVVGIVRVVQAWGRRTEGG
jgi:SAM-dependent methyltransferase